MSGPTTVDADRDSRLLLAAAGVVVLVVLYSVLVVQQVLAAVALLVWVFVVYLLWRFVRAHERLADAAERVASAADASEIAGSDADSPDAHRPDDSTGATGVDDSDED